MVTNNDVVSTPLEFSQLLMEHPKHPHLLNSFFFYVEGKKEQMTGIRVKLDSNLPMEARHTIPLAPPTYHSHSILGK